MENIDWGAVLIQTCVCWFFYKLGQASIIRAITRDLVNLLAEKGIELERNDDGTLNVKKQESETEIDIERVDSQYFAYSTEGEFVAQGNDFKGLFETMKARFPGRGFRINKNQNNLSEEELGQMIKSIFEVFGDKEQSNGQGR